MCRIYGNYQFEDKEIEEFELEQNTYCEIDVPASVGVGFGIDSLTVEASSYESQQIENIHVIGNRCSPKSQNISLNKTL